MELHFHGTARRLLAAQAMCLLLGGQIRAADAAAAAAVGSPRQAQQETTPAFEWQTAQPETQGMSSAKFDALKDGLAAHQSKALLVVCNDKIVYEWYVEDHARDKKHYTASMAKAIVAGVSAAVAMSDGRLSLDNKAAKYVPQWRDDPQKSKITLRQLGSHTSGMDDAESGDLPHNKLTGWQGDFWKHLPVPNDPFTIARDKTPIVFEPGTKCSYSNPGIAMLTYCVTAALRDAPQKDIRTLLHDRVMRPIGVADDQWSAGYGKTDVVDGLPLVGSWGGAAYTARAVARVGRLMLREGDWEGKRLLSSLAVHQITSDAGTPGNCGIGWWSNNEGLYASLPRDAFWGSGAGHQIVLVVPSLKLIAVRNGSTLELGPDEEFDKPLDKYLFRPLLEALNRPAVKSTRSPTARSIGRGVGTRSSSAVDLQP
jgi:CubicO group peptidase (beta-lactamase class C family)